MWMNGLWSILHLLQQLDPGVSRDMIKPLTMDTNNLGLSDG